ncbi:hypothetical protein GR157_23925 [Burkholderia sp. 4701]|nr:hypothetical protein [Burkholderia sp. 4701]MXN84965.1 hypothetical protein [Burkholderia sp. 4812]
MNKAMLGMFGLMVTGLMVTLVIVLATAPTPREKAALAAAKPAKAR